VSQIERIFVVGAGVVGAATGRGFLATGHEVTFVDTSTSRVHELRAEGLDAQTTIDLEGEPASFVFLSLPTPNVGIRYDLRALAAASASVGRALAGTSRAHTVVVRSTVPPGTTDGLVRPLLEHHSGKAMGSDGFGLAANPEFLRAASAEQDFRNPWMTVIGSRDVRTVARLRTLLAPFGGRMQTFFEPGSAELVKCAHNLFNATKISFWNEIWLVACQLGIDPDPVAATVACSAEGSTNPLYGIHGGAPYGGACLPKDTRGFLGFAAKDLGLDMPLLRGVVAVNDRMDDLVDHEVAAAVNQAVRTPS
jgi:UDPglucose 6-dehydrogenase